MSFPQKNLTILTNPRKMTLKLGPFLYLSLLRVSRHAILVTFLKRNLAMGPLWIPELSQTVCLDGLKGMCYLDVCSLLMPKILSIGYVEFRSIDLVEKAIALSGTVVMGLPMMVQLTESERNKLHPGDGYVCFQCMQRMLTIPVDRNLNLPPGVSAPHGAMQYVQSLRFSADPFSHAVF
jgi:hypothetical protein